MTYHYKDGMIYDPEDGQTLATMSESATPEQACILAAAPGLLAALEAFTETMEGLPASDETHLRVWDRYHEAKQAIKQAKGAAT